MQNDTPKQFRHELKYLLNYPDYQILKQRVKSFLKTDKNAQPDGFYTIRSLYFDDYNNSAYYEKYQGVPYRQKYRVRIYNYSDRVIHLERKIKNDRYIFKEIAPLTRDQFQAIMHGDVAFLLNTPYKLHQIFYYEYTTKFLRPRVIVDYEREPFVMEAGDVRVTFDRNIRSGMEDNDIFNENMATIEALDPGKLVLEIKYTTFLPELVRMLVTSYASEFLAVSKYVACCDQTLHRQKIIN